MNPKRTQGVNQWLTLLGDSIAWFPEHHQKQLKSTAAPSKWPSQQEIFAFLAIATAIRAHDIRGALENIRETKKLIKNDSELLPFLKEIIRLTSKEKVEAGLVNQNNYTSLLNRAQQIASLEESSDHVECKDNSAVKTPPEIKSLKSSIRIVLIAPIFERSGYGNGARGIFFGLKNAEIDIRVIPVGPVDAGIDDCSMDEIAKSTCKNIPENSTIIYYSVPHEGLLSLKVPAGTQKIIVTTFEGINSEVAPPKSWIKVLNFFEYVYVPPNEQPGWIHHGLNPERIISHHIIPHVWAHKIPKLGILKNRKSNPIRFLCIGMYAPRRRWDVLLRAFCRAFPGPNEAELVFKVNYPHWHPNPDHPRAELLGLIEKAKHASGNYQANIILDENLGTRSGLANLICQSDYIVNTDSSATQGLVEALLLDRPVITGGSHRAIFDCSTSLSPPVLFFNDKSDKRIFINDEITKYQPHHKGMHMPGIEENEIKKTLLLAKDEKASGVQHDFTEIKNSLRGTNFIYQIVSKAILGNYQRDAKIRIEGSFFSFHSLSKINREIARYFHQSGNYQASIINIGPSDFDPLCATETAYLARMEAVMMQNPDVVIRHAWPPNFERPKCKNFVMIQPWEFGGAPAEWVSQVNSKVDQIWVPSNWVRDCYISSGIDPNRVKTIPNGVDCDLFSPEGPTFKLVTKKTFKFLFLGGTIGRKGIDILLDVYLKNFKASDDVCLVVKGQSGVVYDDAGMSDYISRISKNPNLPEIEYIREGLIEADIAALYRACDCLVIPYRGEGFCMPILEAMATQMPVIATGAGASEDFFYDDWGYKIRSQRVGIDRVSDYQPSNAGFWLEEPCSQHLADLMKEVFTAPQVARRKAEAGRIFAMTMSWNLMGSTMSKEIFQLLMRTG